MLQPIVVVRERAAGVVRRVDEHALHLASELGLQRLQRQQDEIEARRNTIIEDLELQLNQKVSEQALFTVEWELV